MKFISLIIIPLFLFIACSKEKEEVNMINIEYLKDDGSLNSQRLFKKEIEENNKKIRLQKKLKAEEFSK